jgi:hypothetical protein
MTAGQELPHPPRGEVIRLRPLRVLLAGRDYRFLRVTAFLLARRGYDVVQTDSSDLILMAERHRADVVVLETQESRAAAGRSVTVLQTLATSPGLIVVCADGEEWDSVGLRTIRKWAPLDELVDEIEAASIRRQSPLASTDVR